MGSWQGMNWDAAINETRFGEFCDALTTRKHSNWGSDDIRTLNIRELLAREQAENENARSDLYAGADENLFSQSIQAHFSLFSYAKFIKDVRFMIYPISLWFRLANSMTDGCQSLS